MANRQPTLPKREAIDDFGLPHWIDTHRGGPNGDFGWKHFDYFCRVNVPTEVLSRIWGNKTGKTIKDWRERREALGDTGGQG